MNKGITASAVAAALVSALSTVALANESTAPSSAGQDDPALVEMTTARTTSADQTTSGNDFHPDYSQALTLDQMTAAWNAEINRVFQPPFAGGG